MKAKCVTIQMKAIEQYFHVELWIKPYDLNEDQYKKKVMWALVFFACYN